jgi:KDO2-lipid IV(A) lauroyltransferase
MLKEYLNKDYAVYLGARIGISAVSLIPVSAALRIGKIVGLLIYHFHPKRKRIAYANLKAAFGSEKEPVELKRILRDTYKNYGQTITEMLRIPRIDSDYLRERVRVRGIDRIKEAHARGKGVIFFTSHFGNWELSTLKSAQVGFPIHVLARAQRYKKLDGLLNAYREKLGCKVVNRGMSLRAMIRALKDNKIIGILSDQDVGRSGVFIDFFGRPASHAVGAIRLARDTGAAILPSFIVRDGGGHIIYIEEISDVPRTADRGTDITKGLKRQAGTLESYIRRYPDQWMWVYTRWKSTPLRKVVILSDGKRGHLNQSLAALDVIKRCRRDAGFEDEDTLSEIIDVRFRSRFSKTLLSVLAVFASHIWQGDMRMMRFCLILARRSSR